MDAPGKSSHNQIETKEEATIRAYTDGSKYQRGVGSGVVIFKGSDVIARHKFKLSNNCSNNQAKLLAIQKPLEEIDIPYRESINPPTAVIYTDSRVALDSISNHNNHSFLVEEIKIKAASLEEREWSIKFSWVKAHAGTLGNEIADRLAKEPARSENMQYEFDRTPKSTLQHKEEDEAIQECQTGWSTTHKATATRQYFPIVQERLSLKLKLTPKITADLTDHGKTKAYLHGFHLREGATCGCGNEYQSMDHILFHCGNTRAQREIMIRHIGTWPMSKQDLVNKHQKIFSWFEESIDFDDLLQRAQ
jgi:ribonuclease HI